MGVARGGPWGGPRAGAAPFGPGRHHLLGRAAGAAGPGRPRAGAAPLHLLGAALCPGGPGPGRHLLGAALCWLKINFWKEFKSSIFSLLFLNFFKSVRTCNSFQFLCSEALDWQASLKKTRVWLWNQKLMKCLLECLGQIQCAKVPQSLSWNQGVFDTLTWGAIVPHFLHLPRQTNHFRHPSHKPVEQRKEMTFGGRLANVRATVVCSLCCPSSQNLIKKALYEITVNNQG